MPVVGTTAYNTAGQITALVRSLLNDAAGNLFTDAVLLPYVNSAYRKAQRALANMQSGSFLTDDVLLVVPAVAQVDASAQVSITDATAPPNQLPPDLLVPVKLWERANGSSDDFVEMTDLTDHDGLPSEPQAANAGLLGMARRWLVFPGRDAGHADSPALSEVVSRSDRRDQPRADSPGAGSPGLCGRGDGRSRSRRAAGGTLGRGRRGRARGLDCPRHAARTADRPPAQAVFFARRICAAGLKLVA